MPYKTCSHIKTDGTLCKSPALRRKTLCYFHYRWAKREARLEFLGGPLGMENCTGIELPLLESAGDIQLAIQEVLHAILNCKIDRRRASLILYGLQLAQGNLKHIRYNGLSNPNCVTTYREEPSDASVGTAASAVQGEQRSPHSQPPKADPSTPLCSGRDDVTVGMPSSNDHPSSPAPHVRGTEGGFVDGVGVVESDAGELHTLAAPGGGRTLSSHGLQPVVKWEIDPSPGGTTQISSQPRKSGDYRAETSPSRFSDDTSTLVASALSGNPRSAVKLFKLAEKI